MMRVALIDDRRFFRAGLRALLESKLKLSVVAEGKTRDVSYLVKATRPELVLFCYSSYKDAIQPLTQLEQLTKSPAALVITEFISEKGARRLLSLGVSGILLQESASQHLPWAVIAASHGGCALSPEISKQVIHEYTAPATESAQKRAAQERICTLTAREREVLELLSEGLANQAIAHALTISPGTVKDHVRSVCSKLNVDSRFHAARIAWQAKEVHVSA
ncbi:response regulator transcription factor [Streptomyces phaeochromogenes]|uniref:response regulator transcription factor n=1 Tax=Streptomyces phaeochromogenes TaxID=1923 RepID=UPI003673F572